MATFKRNKKIEDEYIEACRDDNLEKVKKILKGKYFQRFPNQQIFLDQGLCSAVRGGFEVMRYLLTSSELPLKADIHENADRPLRLALGKDELKYVEYLCCSPELTEHAHYIKSKDEVPLLVACSRGTVEMVQFLLTSPKLKEHVPIDINNNSRDTPIFKACSYGRLDIVKYLLTSPDLPIKPKLTKECATWACAEGYVDVLRYICFSPDIEEKININEISDCCFQSACERNNLEMMKFLVEECKLTMTAKRDWSGSAFEHAVARADNELFNYILYNMNYEPTVGEVEKTKDYSNPRGISLEESLEKRELLRNLEKNLPTNKESSKKIKI